MKLVSIEFSQVTRLARFENIKGRRYLPDVFAELRNRYEFVQIPQQLEDWDERKGIVLRHGKFRNVLIRQVQFLQNGIIAESNCPSDVVEAFINDLLDWGLREFETDELDLPKPIWSFDSHLVVRGNTSVLQNLDKLRGVARALQDRLSEYGFESLDYQLTGVILHTDLNRLQSILRPSVFTFERRAAERYESDHYFSAAPLPTAEHLSLLEILARD